MGPVSIRFGGLVAACALAAGFTASAAFARPAGDRAMAGGTVSNAKAAIAAHRWRPHIEEASRRFGIPAVWIERVIAAESGGRTELYGRPITSHAGAMGLMQLMPGTWAEMRRHLGLGSDPHDPRDNILAGSLYLRMMHDRFGYPGLFGAYNAGPARYAAYLGGRQSLPSETRAYIRKVASVGNPDVGGVGIVPQTRAAMRPKAPGDVVSRDARSAFRTGQEADIFFIRR